MKKKVCLMAGGLALSAALALSGCGGGGGGTAAVSGGGSGGTTLSGKASKGPLNGAKVTAYKITDGSKGAKLGESATDVNGDYILNVSYEGDVLIEITGGTYKDEATGETVTLGSTLRAATAATKGSNTIAVTPLTELAAQLAEADGSLSDIAEKNTQVSNLIQADIISTLPADATNAAEYAAATTDKQKYALMLATIAQYSNTSGKTLDAVVDELETDLGDNLLDATADSLMLATGTFLGSAQNKTGKITASDTNLYGALAEAKTTEVSSTAKTYAMKVAEKVSVVDAKEGSSPSSKIAAMKIGMLQAAVPAADLPLDSDYHVDKTVVFMDDQTTEAFEQVNEILCMMGQTRYDKMLNQGVYRAQVDVAQCESGRDDVSQGQESSQNQTSGSNMPEYEYWTVRSTRVDNFSPQIVEAWIHESGEAEYNEPDMLIMAKVEITEGKSDTNPYGLFTANFIAYPTDENGQPLTDMGQFKGFLKTEKNDDGLVAFKYAENGSFEDPQGNTAEFSQLSSFTRSADGATGNGTVQVFDPWMAEMGDGEKSFNFAFNENNFRRVAGNDDVCLSRTNFRDIVWRYGLYNADDSFVAADRGMRVTRNSGFPIKYNDYHGWVGYWGVWLPDEANLPSSGTVEVVKEEYGPDAGEGTPYTLKIIGGKLIRHTRQAMTLANLKGIPMEYWDNTTGDQYRVEWDGTNFKKVSKLTDQMNWQWSEWDEILSLTSLQWPELNFWSQGLGGQVRIRFEYIDPENPLNNKFCDPNGDPPESFDCSNSGFAEVIFYSEETVFPGESVPAELACFENCPDGSNINNPDSSPVYADTSWNNQDVQNLSFQNVAPDVAGSHNYNFAGNVLHDIVANEDVVRTVDGSGDYQWGFHSGPLVEPTVQNLDKLACDWDDTGNSTCAWQAWNLDEYFTWETGPNQWNKVTVLMDGSSVVPFDKPLMVTYQVPETPPAGIPPKLAGAKFQLDYQGFGELHGIPGVCTDRETGDVTNCGPGTDWKPQFSIPNGAEVCDGSIAQGVCQGKTYLVKALEKGQRMLKEENGCTDLTTTTLELPSIGTWVDPDLGTEPTVTAPPAVIGGVLQ